MSVADKIINKIIRQYPCCRIWTVSVSSLADREKKFFNYFMPSARTAIVLGHHITKKTEWTWYLKKDNLEYCAADNHTLEVCRKFKQELESHNYRTEIISYPGESGLQFKHLAQAAGAGMIGINALLLHPDWGPRIHLRVLAVQVQLQTVLQTPEPVCNNCGICISACPAGAIQSESFNGLLCRSYRTDRGEYKPIDSAGQLAYCTTCIDVCPVGREQ